MQNQLQKVINLVKKTGDKIIVFDNIKQDSVYVIMSLKDYESLVLGKSEVRGLTEDELLDKINRDIAIWKSEQDFMDSTHLNQQNFDLNEESNFRNIDFNKVENEKKKLEKAWTIPSNIKKAAEEVIEEDTQYLEDIVLQ